MHFIKTALLSALIISTILFACACTGGTGQESTTETSAASISSQETTRSETTTQTTVAETSAEEGTGEIRKVTLQNSPGDVGNYNSSFSHFDFNISYNGEYVVIIDRDTMYLHGEDTAMQPLRVNGFSQISMEPKYHDGRLYYIVDEDGSNTYYYLYSWDFVGSPVKVTDRTVYTYLILKNKVFFTEDFVQGPLYSLDLSTGAENKVSELRAMSFTTDGEDLYFKSADVGTAPGIVRIDMHTMEEELVIFPFFSNNYIVYDGYVYFEGSSSYDINISKQAFNSEEAVILAELPDYILCLNISSGKLYFQTENYIKSCSLDGSDVKIIYEGTGELSRGSYIIGDRIYFRDYDIFYMVHKDGSGFTELIPE